METIKEIKEIQPSITEYEVYDDYIKLHKSIANSDEFTFQRDADDFKKEIINGSEYYHLYNWGYTYKLLTPSAYQKMMNECQRVYSLHESNLIRHQKNSNTRFTGDLKSKEDVIAYMRDEERSWLPQVYKEIDEEIAELKRIYEEKVYKLSMQKITLMDDEHLKSNIDTRFYVISKK